MTRFECYTIRTTPDEIDFENALQHLTFNALNENVMKSFFSLLAILLSSTMNMHAQVIIRNCKQSEKSNDIQFPLISNPSNISAGNRMNDFLQLTFADQTLIKTNEADLFQEVVYTYSENESHGSLTSLNYEVKLNQPAVLSLLFNGETMGAYPDFYENGYNFNAYTGDLFTLEDICTTEGYKKLKTLITSKRQQKIKTHLNELLKDPENKDAVKEYDLENEFNECITTYASYAFIVNKQGVKILHHRCLPHVIQALDGDFSFQLDNNMIKPFLNSYGKNLLIDKIPVKEAFHQNPYNHLLYGKIGTTPIAIYMDRFYKNEINAYYFYLSQGKKISCLGEIKNSIISLKCYSETDEKLQEIIEGQFKKGSLIGTWRKKSDPPAKTIPFIAR